MSQSRYEPYLARGRNYFFLHDALLRFALPLAIVTLLVLHVLLPLVEGEGLPGAAYLASGPFVRTLMASLILWPLLGYLWAVLVWRKHGTRDGARG